MTKLVFKLTLAASALAISCVLCVPGVRAEEKADSAAKDEKKKSPDEETVKKYDKNANGKLDPDEEAAMKADQEKIKTEKKKKERGN